VIASAPVADADTKSTSGCQSRFSSFCSPRVPSAFVVSSLTSMLPTFGNPRSGNT
jgi:hypothetical protein